MQDRHLRLINSQCQMPEQTSFYIKYFENIKDFFDKIFTSEPKKIYIIKDILIKLYRDYEISTGIENPPYYVKAEIRIIKIIKEGKIDYYYKLFKKFKNINFE